MTILHNDIDNVIIGSENTIFKRDKKCKRYEIWDFCYTQSHLEDFPQKKFLDTVDGVIARFLVTRKDNVSTMILLPQRLIGKKDNDIAVIVGDDLKEEGGDLATRKACERLTDRYDIFEDAMDGVKIYNPTVAFTNFFKEAKITATDFTGWFRWDGYCFGNVNSNDVRQFATIENRFLKVNITPNYPVGWLNGELIMTTWDKTPKKFILENPTQLDFSKNETISRKMIMINIESDYTLHNTGELVSLDYRKMRFLTKANSINDWEDVSKNPYGYFSVYKGKEDYKNRVPAEFIINRAPNLVEVHLDLPERSNLSIFHAAALERITNTTRLRTLRCDRRLRSMYHDKELYSFLVNLASLEKPLAENVEIEMGFFNYVGIWGGFTHYLPKFFEWLDEKDNDYRNEKSSRNKRLLEDGFFIDE